MKLTGHLNDFVDDMKAQGRIPADLLERYGEAISERFGARALNHQSRWQIPGWVKLPLASGLMRPQWFTRKVVTEKWFLHQQVPPLESAL